jgi:hypothetical protein
MMLVTHSKCMADLAGETHWHAVSARWQPQPRKSPDTLTPADTFAFDKGVSSRSLRLCTLRKILTP